MFCESLHKKQASISYTNDAFYSSSIHWKISSLNAFPDISGRVCGQIIDFGEGWASLDEYGAIIINVFIGNYVWIFVWNPSKDFIAYHWNHGACYAKFRINRNYWRKTMKAKSSLVVNNKLFLTMKTSWKYFWRLYRYLIDNRSEEVTLSIFCLLHTFYFHILQLKPGMWK